MEKNGKLKDEGQFHKGRMKGDDPSLDTVQTPKRFDVCLAFLEKVRKTFIDTICLLSNMAHFR